LTGPWGLRVEAALLREERVYKEKLDPDVWDNVGSCVPITQFVGACRVGVVLSVRLGWCRVGGLLAAMRGEEGPIAGATAWLYITAQLLC
jgi:hypothetical protein